MGVQSEGPIGFAIATIAVAGFPMDASTRELRNFCRLYPGFQKAAPRLIPGRPAVLFAKFESQELASECIFRLQDFVFDEEFWPEQKLKAEFARREMQDDMGQHHSRQQPWQAGQAPIVGGLMWQPEPPSYSPQKRPRTAIRPIAPALAPAARPWTSSPPQSRIAGAFIDGRHFDGVDTLACKVLPEQTGQGLRQFFQQHAGFVALKDNGKNCFLKFESHVAASSALAAAQQAGITAELARSSMTLKSSEGGGQPEHRPEFQHPEAAWGQVEWRPPQQQQQQPRRHQGSEAPWGGEADTIACKAGAFSEQDFQDFFGACPGFVRMKFNVKNCFLKFASPELAQEAIHSAAEAGHAAELARFSLP